MTTSYDLSGFGDGDSPDWTGEWRVTDYSWKYEDPSYPRYWTLTEDTIETIEVKQGRCEVVKTMAIEILASDEKRAEFRTRPDEDSEGRKMRIVVSGNRMIATFLDPPRNSTIQANETITLKAVKPASSEETGFGCRGPAATLRDCR